MLIFFDIYDTTIQYYSFSNIGDKCLFKGVNINSYTSDFKCNNLEILQSTVAVNTINGPSKVNFRSCNFYCPILIDATLMTISSGDSFVGCFFNSFVAINGDGSLLMNSCVFNTDSSLTTNDNVQLSLKNTSFEDSTNPIIFAGGTSSIDARSSVISTDKISTLATATGSIHCSRLYKNLPFQGLTPYSIKPPMKNTDYIVIMTPIYELITSPSPVFASVTITSNANFNVLVQGTVTVPKTVYNMAIIPI